MAIKRAFIPSSSGTMLHVLADRAGHSVDNVLITHRVQWSSWQAEKMWFMCCILSVQLRINAFYTKH